MCINHVLLFVMMCLVQLNFILQEVLVNVMMTAKRIPLHHIDVVGVSLSESHSNVNTVQWSMHEEPQRKMGLQPTTTVWYSNSCTN